LTHTIEINQTSSGTPSTWSFNTQKFTENVYLRQIIVKSLTGDTTFDFYILDGTKNSNPIFDTRDEVAATGTLRREVNIPLVGIHTIAITNASRNEAFTGKLVIEERIR